MAPSFASLSREQPSLALPPSRQVDPDRIGTCLCVCGAVRPRNRVTGGLLSVEPLSLFGSLYMASHGDETRNTVRTQRVVTD